LNRLQRSLLFRLKLIFCWSVTFVYTGSAQEQPTPLLDEGIRLLGQGHFLEAVSAFNRYKQLAPADPRPYFYAGMALTETGRLSAAAMELSEAANLAPRRGEYRIFQANVFLRLKQTIPAVDALALFDNKEVAKQLDSAWLWLLADVYSRLDQSDAALQTLDLLAKRNPQDFRVDLKRGQIQITRGEIDLAEGSFKNSIKKSSKNPVAHFELGKILHQRNELSASKKVLLEAARQDPGNPEYLHRLSLICLALDEVVEAIEYLRRAEPSAAGFPQIYYALGSALQRNGDRTKAREYRKKYQEFSLAERAKEDREREVGKLIKSGEKQLDEGNKAEARISFERIVQLDPDNWDAHGYLAEMFLSSQDWQRSYEHLARMEEIDPESAVGNYLLAKYWFHQKEFKKANVYAERVKLLRPGHAELRNLLGNTYLGLGETDKALREFEAAVQLAPDRSDFRNDLLKLKNLKSP